MAVIFLLGSLNIDRADFLLLDTIATDPTVQELTEFLGRISNRFYSHNHNRNNNIQNKAHDQILRYTELAAPIGVHVAALVDFVVKDIGFCNHLPPPGLTFFAERVITKLTDRRIVILASTGSAFQYRVRFEGEGDEKENSVIPEHDRWLFAWKLVDLGYRHLIEQWEEEKNGSRPPPENTEETAETWEEALAKAMKWRYPLGQRRVPNESLDDLVRRFLAVAFTPQHGALYWKLLECPRAELECIRVEFKASAFEGRHEAEYIVELDHGQMLLVRREQTLATSGCLFCANVFLSLSFLFFVITTTRCRKVTCQRCPRPTVR